MTLSESSNCQWTLTGCRVCMFFFLLLFWCKMLKILTNKAFLYTKFYLSGLIFSFKTFWRRSPSGIKYIKYIHISYIIYTYKFELDTTGYTWYMSFCDLFIVNTEQLEIHKCTWLYAYNPKCTKKQLHPTHYPASSAHCLRRCLAFGRVGCMISRQYLAYVYCIPLVVQIHGNF